MFFVHINTPNVCSVEIFTLNILLYNSDNKELISNINISNQFFLINILNLNFHILTMPTLN